MMGKKDGKKREEKDERLWQEKVGARRGNLISREYKLVLLVLFKITKYATK